MSRKRRKGSSTRKFRSQPPKSPPKTEIQVLTPTTEDDQRAVIKQIEDLIRSGKNKKGADLTQKEISTFLTTISHLEHKLGIIHP